MDVYNLFGAADAVVDYLAGVDPGAAARARTGYRCFARYRPEAERYGIATRQPSRSCASQAAAVLTELRARPRPADPVAAEALFSAVRSAASVVGAEEYHRASAAGSMSWNVRDRRMASTVVEIADHAAALSGQPGKVVVWAHNSHVGDARATDAPQRGEVNLGQLMRERAGAATFLLGFTTYGGTVMAAQGWGEPGRVHTLRPALAESDAGRFHAAGVGNALFLLGNGSPAARLFQNQRLQRAVGVIYARATERQSHYLPARVAQQFDALIHWDMTRAVTPLR
jgi:erythromycin esterase-like protein